STTHNIGFESQWLDNKLGFDIEFFHRFTVDIINPASGIYPPTMGGFFPSSVNDGEMLNRGVDIQLRYNNQVNGFRYSLTGNFNWARNKIIRRQESENLPAWQRTVGRPYGQKLGIVVDGIYQTSEETQAGVSPSAGLVAPAFFKCSALPTDGRITRPASIALDRSSNPPDII